MQNPQEPASIVSLISSAQESAPAITAKASLPVGVVVAERIGFTVSELIQYLTALWLLLLVVQKIWHLWDKWKTGREMDDAEEDPL